MDVCKGFCQERRKMSWSDQVDVVNTGILQMKKNTLKLLYGKRPANGLKTDLMVLAEYTAHIAGAEKDSSRTACSTDTRFFPIMGSGTNDTGEGRTLAEAFTIMIIPKGVAFSGAVIADVLQMDPS